MGVTRLNRFPSQTGPLWRSLYPSKVKQGQWVELAGKEIKSLYRMADLPLKDMKRGTIKEREKMERQFSKRKGPGGSSARSGRKPR